MILPNIWKVIKNAPDHQPVYDYGGTSRPMQPPLPNHSAPVVVNWMLASEPTSATEAWDGETLPASADNPMDISVVFSGAFSDPQVFQEKWGKPLIVVT